jgi:hypothetical protein
MKRTLAYPLLMVLFLSAAESTWAQTAAAEKVISRYISKEAKTQSADEYARARKIVYGDLDSDGDRDAAVLYTLEGFGGGNNFVQRLAISINQRGVYKFAVEESVGSKMGGQTTTLKSVSKKGILLDTESCPEPPQGICRNPKKGQATVGFRNGKLIKSRGRLL